MKDSNKGNTNRCYGCGGCEQICPVSCITMQPDEMGFLYPNIDTDRCIECNQCVDVCPIEKNKEKIHLSCVSYKCKNTDDTILKKSSSGGVFYGLAKQCLQQNGVVFGAAYDEQQSVYHTYVENIEELDKLCQSKYVQSRIGDSFKHVADFLKKGRKVLFVGMPCQVAACREYLKTLIQQKKLSTNVIEHLLLVDLICGSVPSPKVYACYLKELEKDYTSKIKKVNHREKNGYNWSDYAISVAFDNGMIVKEAQKENHFMMGFIHKLYSRDCCFQCDYKRMNSQSDITMGDMILKDRTAYTCEEEKGLSVLILKTEKGKERFNQISKQYVVEKIGIEDMTETNHLWEQHRKHIHADNFKKEFLQEQYGTLKKLVWKHLSLAGKPEIEEKKYRFGIFGGWNTRAVLRKLVDDRYNNKMSYHISKSSLISLYSPAERAFLKGLRNRGNSYRYQMVCMDIAKDFRTSLKQQLQNIDILLVDFLEEQYNLLQLGNRTIITDSDALRECAGEDVFEQCTEILQNEDARIELWKEACEQWIRDILEVIDGKQIILFCMYLSEKKGHDGNIVESFWKQQEHIKTVNKRLDICYKYFIENCPEIRVIELPDIQLQYTDIMHKYGCVPEHLNEEAYAYLADELYHYIINV